LLVERRRVGDADPDPRPEAALIALRQEDVAVAARHGRESLLRAAPVLPETEHVDVVAQALREAPHAENGRDPLEGDRPSSGAAGILASGARLPRGAPAPGSRA